MKEMIQSFKNINIWKRTMFEKLSKEIKESEKIKISSYQNDSEKANLSKEIKEPKWTKYQKS